MNATQQLASGSTAKVQRLSERPAWKALEAHFAAIRNLHLRQLFADDPHRGERFTAEVAGIYLDYSKNRITDETIRLLLALAGECGLPERIVAMFGGERINVTEKRAVLHVALRAPESERIVVDGVDVVPEVHAVLERMSAFSLECEVAMARIYGQANPQCHQHRHRRLRPRAGNGL